MLSWPNIVCHAIICLTLSGNIFVDTTNYPDGEYNRKACSRLKNTITYQKPICVPDGNNGFIKETELNCKGSFKDTCPEFNKAVCKWFNNSRPCCRLKYHAKGRTWMEIYYSMQYGPEDNDERVHDIVEIHRKVLDYSSFGSVWQSDWPYNVLDSTGERGLKWQQWLNLTEPFLSYNMSFKPQLCHKIDDDFCHKTLNRDALSLGWLTNGVVKLSSLESTILKSTGRFNETIETQPACINILVNKKRMPACQVLFVRRSILNIDHEGYTGPLVSTHTSSFVFLEVNFYHQPYESILSARYAYYSDVDPELRYRMFSDD